VSRTDDLLAALCPGEVPFRSIGELGELVRGNGMPKSDFAEAGVGCIHYGQIYTFYGTWATETISFIAPEKAARLAKVNPGDLIITNTSENLDDVCKAVAWLGAEQIVTGGHATVLRHDQDPKYLSYYLQTPAFFSEKKKQATGTKVIDVSARNLANITIPVPPLDVQREIAKVLDTFSELEADLEAELKAELVARRRQYEYHRDSLLSFREAGGVRWLPMGEVGTFTRGRRFVKDDIVDDGLPAIHYGEIYTHYGTSADTALSHVRAEIASTLRFARQGDVVIAAVGETVEDVGKAVAWLGDGPVAVHDDCFTFSHAQNPKFIAYCLQTAALNADKDKYVSRAKVKRLSADGLGKLLIPVPPLDEQERIVTILDKFDALVNDLSIGLPAEVTARRQQYEYYRDRLLTFEERVA
jgi:type I restriction enzyme, S subunit